MMEILYNIILQVIYTIGIVIIFGLIIALCNKTFYKLFDYSDKIIFATSILGTPIHEIGHAIFCVLFGHKIIKIKLFQNDESGVLGYVEHSYNPRNVYHQIGNFFIAIGPIVFGSFILLLLMNLLTPDLYYEYYDLAYEYSISNFNVFSTDSFSSFITLIIDIIYLIFSLDFIKSIGWWGYLIICLCVSLHMNLSPSDIKISFKGLLIILLSVVIFNVITYFIKPDIAYITTDLAIISGTYIVGFLLISIVFSIILVIIAYAYNKIKKKMSMKKIF